MTNRSASLTGLLVLLSHLSAAFADEPLGNSVFVSEHCSTAGELACRQAVSDSDLSNMRGGFFTAEGAQFDFGANVQTLINGQLALQTTVNWTPTGLAVQQAANIGTVIASQTVPINDSNLRATTATGSADGPGLSVSSGPFAATPIVAFANVGNGQLQNILINRADNQTISQNTNITFTIYNFAAWQQQLSQNALSVQVINEIRAAAGLGGSR